MNIAEKIMSFLEQNPIQILSTSINNKAISRPIGSASLLDGKIYFCMNKNKAMFEELCINPHICLCVCAKDFSWIRIFATVVFDENKSLKEEFIKLGKTRFKNSDEENFKIFYLSKLQAELNVNGIKTLLKD